MDEKKLAEIKRLTTIGVLLSPENARELIKEIERLQKRVAGLEEQVKHEHANAGN